MTQADVVVLGAGMVGISAALHLQARGRDVAIVDRLGNASGETSYGNAGIIEGCVIQSPYFPRNILDLLGYALNRETEAHYLMRHLAQVAPWMWAYWRASSPARAAASTKSLLALVKHAIPEHEVLIADAEAGALVKKTGWIKLYFSDRRWKEAQADVAMGRANGLAIDEWTQEQLRAREPSLTVKPLGIHFYHEALACLDPGALGEAYAALFVARGGRLLKGDARTLSPSGSGWQVTTESGPVMAREAVVALGPWSDDVFRPLGYRFPLGVKRGYHMHYAPGPGAELTGPVLNGDSGFVLAPMTKGIRMTTGVQFLPRDAGPLPVQVERLEPVARAMMPLGERRDPQPWLGRRPCLPDLLPVIGKGARHKGLWFDFGHQHLGLTLGPASGRLLAEMMTGEAPFTDPAPYAGERFG